MNEDSGRAGDRGHRGIDRRRVLTTAAGTGVAGLVAGYGLGTSSGNPTSSAGDPVSSRANLLLGETSSLGGALVKAVEILDWDVAAFLVGRYVADKSLPLESKDENSPTPIEFWQIEYLKNFVNHGAMAHHSIAEVLDGSDIGTLRGVEGLSLVAKVRLEASRREATDQKFFFDAAKNAFIKLERAGSSSWMQFCDHALSRFQSNNTSTYFFQACFQSAALAVKSGERGAQLNWPRQIARLAATHPSDAKLRDRAFQAWDEFLKNPGEIKRASHAAFEAISPNDATRIASIGKAWICIEHANVKPALLETGLRYLNEASSPDHPDLKVAKALIHAKLATASNALNRDHVNSASTAIGGIEGFFLADKIRSFLNQPTGSLVRDIGSYYQNPVYPLDPTIPPLADVVSGMTLTR